MIHKFVDLVGRMKCITFAAPNPFAGQPIHKPLDVLRYTKGNPVKFDFPGEGIYRIECNGQLLGNEECFDGKKCVTIGNSNNYVLHGGPPFKITPLSKNPKLALSREI